MSGAAVILSDPARHSFYAHPIKTRAKGEGRIDRRMDHEVDVAAADPLRLRGCP
jgi:hypothetical protein